MHRFDISLKHQRQGDNFYPVVVEHTQPDGLLPVQAEGQFVFDDALKKQLQQLALQPQAYGEALGKALFPDKEAEDSVNHNLDAVESSTDHDEEAKAHMKNGGTVPTPPEHSYPDSEEDSTTPKDSKYNAIKSGQDLLDNC